MTSYLNRSVVLTIKGVYRIVESLGKYTRLWFVSYIRIYNTKYTEQKVYLVVSENWPSFVFDFCKKYERYEMEISGRVVTWFLLGSNVRMFKYTVRTF